MYHVAQCNQTMENVSKIFFSPPFYFLLISRSKFKIFLLFFFSNTNSALIKYCCIDKLSKCYQTIDLYLTVPGL